MKTVTCILCPATFTVKATSTRCYCDSCLKGLKEPPRLTPNLHAPIWNVVRDTVTGKYL